MTPRDRMARIKAGAYIPLITTRVADVTDETLFPEFALAAEHRRNMTPERRAELESE